SEHPVKLDRKRSGDQRAASARKPAGPAGSAQPAQPRPLSPAGHQSNQLARGVAWGEQTAGIEPGGAIPDWSIPRFVRVRRTNREKCYAKGSDDGVDSVDLFAPGDTTVERYRQRVARTGDVAWGGDVLAPNDAGR
ncbi:MAG: hypothetical protein ACRDGQ_08165, partial [Candidatus Limnocylindrales bacterium]